MSAKFAYYDREADIAWLPTGDSADVVSEEVEWGLVDHDSATDEVVAAVSTGIGRVQDHIGACVADGIHAGIYRQVNAREIADLAWSVLLGSLGAAEMQTNLGLGTEVLASRTDRALALVESALAPTVAGSLRAVA